MLKLGTIKDSPHAQALLAEATEVAGRLAMVPLQEKVAALLEGQPTRPPAHPDGLTDRELEVVGLVAKGYTDREIGGLLSMSPKTASNHVRNILAKTGTANRAEAAAYAARAGLDHSPGGGA